MPRVPDEHIEAVKLFNDEEFFEAHEQWELLWNDTLGQEKLNYQGLIQLAACFLQVQRGFYEGSRKLYRKAAEKFEKAEPAFHGIVIEELLAEARGIVDALPADARGGHMSHACDFPKLTLPKT